MWELKKYISLKQMFPTSCVWRAAESLLRFKELLGYAGILSAF